jgi:hypothetical protein
LETEKEQKRISSGISLMEYASVDTSFNPCYFLMDSPFQQAIADANPATRIIN